MPSSKWKMISSTLLKIYGLFIWLILHSPKYSVQMKRLLLYKPVYFNTYYINLKQQTNTVQFQVHEYVKKF